MNFINYFVILLIYLLPREINTYRILGVFPVVFRSHSIFFEAIMKGLAKEGHQVEVVTHYELPNPPQNYRTILNLATLDFPYPPRHFDDIQEVFATVQDIVGILTEVYGNDMCKLMGYTKMQDIIRNLSKDPAYDVVIVEGYTMNCINGLGRLLNVPVVTLTPSLEFPWVTRQIGNPLSTAFYSTFTFKRAEVKIFWDRLKNTVQSHISIQRFFFDSEQVQTEAMRKFISPDMPNIREIEKSSALSLVNTHHSLQGIRPMTPAFIEVGGLHIEEDNSTITAELQQWMDESKNGVVYISFGSLIPLESLPSEILLIMYKSFSKIAPTRVLMKASNKLNLPSELPGNVIIMPWVPQIPILRHNNTRAFITHGGAHSTQEAVYYGIPTIGVPLIYDQQQNTEILVKKKMSVQIKYDEITEKSLDEALREILNDPKYRKAAQYQSKLFRDRPMSPKKTAIYWIEYVIRNGAKSLRTPALDLYWWQVELLDVYGFLLLFMTLILYIIVIIFKTVFRKLFRGNLKTQLKRN